jgi:hypothetical protein
VPGPAPALVVLRDQIVERWPSVPRSRLGIMGDAAHRLRKSAHNQGNALDVPAGIPGGPDVGAMVEDLCRQMRANPGGRLALIIYRRRKYRARDLWRGVTYLGVNPHTSHAHIEVKPQLRGITRRWSLRG